MQSEPKYFYKASMPKQVKAKVLRVGRTLFLCIIDFLNGIKLLNFSCRVEVVWANKVVQNKSRSTLKDPIVLHIMPYV